MKNLFFLSRLRGFGPQQSFISALGRLLGFVVLVSLIPLSVWASPDTPNLPLALKKSGKPALLEFYAQWCGSCQRMHPYVQKMINDAHGKVDWIRVDIDDPKMARYGKDFHIAGTPTFIMFDSAGHPTFRMERRISASLLRMIVAQSYGGMGAKPLPANVKPIQKGDAVTSHLKANAKPYTVVRFASAACQTTGCKQDDAYFNAMTQHLAKQAGQQVQWAALNPDDTSDVKYLHSLISLRKPYRPEAGRYYVLLNRQGVPLMRVNQTLNPKWGHSLMTVLQLMLNGERGV